MSQRLLNNTKWIWCLLVAMWGPSPVHSNSMRTPPKVPATVEAQAKFFQDFFSVQLSPYKIEFGHVCEDPNTWEQRYEKKDFKNHRDMGKVRWGDKKGGYGEHYWDLNHAGHADNHGHEDFGSDNDGSYKINDEDPYDEPSEQSPSFNTEYDPERSASSEETNRAKRAHDKVKENDDAEQKTYGLKIKNDGNNEEPRKERKPAKLRRYKPKEQNYEEEVNQRGVLQTQQRDLNQDVKPQIADQSSQTAARLQNPEQTVPRRHHPEQTRYVPYEDGSGVRQHQTPEITPAASVPRLFLEPSTGHVVDRATGQAYLLQPIVANYN